MDLITIPNELDQASIATLIKNLYPSSKVSDETALKAIGALGHGQSRASFVTQTLLLKWLVMVYDVLENPKVVSQAYSFLFNLLGTIAIRAPLCHVLSLITRRRHVRPFRIQMLLELARKVGNEPALIGLIRVYKDYYPDVIVGEITASRASVFTHPSPEWKQRLLQIQEAHAQRSQEDHKYSQEAFRVVRRGINGVKRSRVSAVPEVHTFQAQETSVTLEEIEGVQAFINKLEKIELPNQLVAAMGDPLLQMLLQLTSTGVTRQRVDNWLLAFFEDQLQSDDNSERALLDMLASILDYVRFTKELPQACTRYLQSTIKDWNGVVGRDAILGLLSCTPLSPWDELYSSTFYPLEFCIIEGGTQIDLLDFYTSLLTNWTTTLLSNPPPDHATATISSLTTHVNTLALTILSTSTKNRLHAASSILSFYETSAHLISLPSLRGAIRITTPPSTLIYTLHFSPSLPSLSRLCAILAIYKRAFETAMSGPVLDLYPKEYVNHFNGFLMDICNCLWRSRAFNTGDTNALGCLLPQNVVAILSQYVSSLETGLSLQSLFSLSYSPLLCNFSISYLRELEDRANGGKGVAIRHAGPVAQKSLLALGREGGLQVVWPQYRLGVLKYLEDKGVGGVGELMYNTMKHLMGQREVVVGRA